MYDLGLAADPLRFYLGTLVTHHTLRMRVQILDLEHGVVASVTNRVIDGQVTIDDDADEATRELKLTLFDPGFNLGFDTPAVDNGIWFFDRMVQVHAEVWVEELGRVIECPIFTGPIRKFQRSGALISMTCLGKDVFARQAWPRMVIKKGTNRVEGIRKILRELGETKFRFEITTKAVFGADKVVDRNMTLSPWGYCRTLAATMDAHLFYAGDGYAVLRAKAPDTPVYEFRGGEGGSLLTAPDDAGDYSRLANVVRAEGMLATNGDNPYDEQVVDIKSPLHPSKLERGGKDFYMGVVIIRDSIRDKADARAVAKAELADRQKAAYTTAFDAFPIFTLEEGDAIALKHDGSRTVSTLSRLRFGFRPSDVMPIGYRKLVAPQVAKIRRF